MKQGSDNMIKIECIIVENKGSRVYYSNVIPRIGETIVYGKKETFRVLDVIHYSDEHSAVSVIVEEI
ncbi:hypothetical protein [Romboutsia timonensis]|uniref:hypothetical protein n=1 Tax=Romboutsia timonensis TaxID=1776391 RepID=UPI0023F864BA|nr:hypothetical protein [Romboutsia timonensis]